jgi:hypothetical protein
MASAAANTSGKQNRHDQEHAASYDQNAEKQGLGDLHQNKRRWMTAQILATSRTERRLVVFRHGFVAMWTIHVFQHQRSGSSQPLRSLARS